jgi:signal transduction histidine kinase
MPTQQDQSSSLICPDFKLAAGPVVASIQQAQSLAGMRKDRLLQRSYLSRDELVQTANELSQLADYLAQVSRTRSQFLGKVAHELRTPLTIVKGWVSMLCYGDLLPEQERVIAVINEQIDDLTRLVNDLMDLSRREVGTLELDLETVELTTLVEQVAEHQRELVMLQGIQLAVHTPMQRVYTRVDRGRIAQVLSNLIHNACRYVPHHGDGRVELLVAVSETAVQISVRDNGAGIDPEQLPRIFEPFYQVEGRARGKSGLGLTIAQDLVQAHGGALTVESAIGQGSSFHIWLRRAEPPKPTPMARRETQS